MRVAITLALTACASPVRVGQECQQESRPIRVRVAADVVARIAIDSVRQVAAPAVVFPGQIRTDPGHINAVQAPGRGTVASIDDERHVVAGDTVASIASVAAPETRTPVVASRDGTWVPRRQVNQLVSGDTLGLLEDHGYWLAVGAVSDIAVGVIHEGDPGWVELGPGLRLRQWGRVAWVRGPDPRLPYTAEVALRLQASVLRQGQPVTITVTPVGPGDSLPAVPSTAVVQLTHGRAVFVPVGPNEYEVRWVRTGGSVDGFVSVRGELALGTLVVSDGLAALTDAVRDSLPAPRADCRR